MKINNNISAVMTNNQLLRNENSLTEVMERLSSGFKINHAKDDPSGIAISSKMQAQIDALDQSSTNASNGMSVLETADGALNEVTSMIQRMRELAVQAANDINMEEELDDIQLEISSLKEEIDRISSTTEFNTKNLLDGSLDARVYGNNVSRLQVSSTVSAGYYNFSVTVASEQATIPSATATSPVTATCNSYADVAALVENGTLTGSIQINGYEIALATTDVTDEQIYQKLREGAERADCTITDINEWPPKFTTNKFGSDASLTVSVDNKDLADALGLPYDVTDDCSSVGKNAEISLDRADPSQFDNQTTVLYEGNKLTFSNRNNFKMTLMLEEGYTGAVSVEVTNIGPMTLQIGANEGQTMEVRIPSIDTEHLYLDTVDVSTITGAEEAIATLDDALSVVSSIRASLGAYENRLEHTVSSLDATDENMNSAISRIEDADMATEMVEYTRYNVLEQASVSALSQANELPQLALQLLQ